MLNRSDGSKQIATTRRTERAPDRLRQNRKSENKPSNNCVEFKKPKESETTKTGR